MSAALDVEAVRRWGFREFVKIAWHQVEASADLVWSWHLDAICNHLESVSRGEIRDLVINVPPGMSKSLLVSVLWPAWHWISDPGHRFGVGSYGSKIVNRDALKMRTLMKSLWYQERWSHVKIVTDNSKSDSAGTFSTSSGGMRYSQTVKGIWTGEHFDTLIVDDPIDPRRADATSGVELTGVLHWWSSITSTRFRDHKKSRRVCIMQRLHENDLAAKMLSTGAKALCLPMRFEPNHPHRWLNDQRFAGELLCPERVPELEVARLETTLGPMATAAQFQQRPAPAEGAIFRDTYFKHTWTTLPNKGVGTWTQSWDCTFKALSDSDYVVGQVWFQHGPNYYLVDQVRGRWTFSQTCKEVIALSERYPQARKKLVEDKANGTAVMDVLRSTLQGLVPVEPRGKKETRANACEPLWAAGNVFLPHAIDAKYDPAWTNLPEGTERTGAAWVADLIQEHLVFPNGAHDDQVDAATQYLSRDGAHRSDRLERAMAAIFKGPNE